MSFFVTMATRNLLQGGRRFVLLAITFVTLSFFIVLSTSLFNGAYQRMIDIGCAVHGGHVVLGGLSWIDGQWTELVKDLESTRAIVEKWGRASVIAPRDANEARALGPNGSKSIFLLGVVPSEDPLLLDAIVDGLPGNPGVESVREMLTSPDTAVIFDATARDIGVKVGDVVTLIAMTPRGVMNTVEVVVDAIPKGNAATSGVVITNIEVTRRLYQIPPGGVTRIYIYLDSPQVAIDGQRSLRDLLEKNGAQLGPLRSEAIWTQLNWAKRGSGKGQVFYTCTWKDMLRSLLQIQGAIENLSVAIFALLCLIVGIGTFNIMSVVVRQRVHEIGTLRALGLSRSGVATLLAAEALLLGALSSMVGGALAWLAAAVLNLARINVDSQAFADIFFSNVLHFNCDWSTLGVVILLVTCVTVVSVLWPAIRAAALDPAKAVRL